MSDKAIAALIQILDAARLGLRVAAMEIAATHTLDGRTRADAAHSEAQDAARKAREWADGVLDGRDE